MTCTVRTRFAPSPTGFLHVGGARTALFAWLYARHHQGEFILRIEDTDRERSTDEAVQLIHEGMAWLGLDWDEGPYYQTQRFDRYALALKQLLDSGQAYRCYCSKERLTELRETQLIKKQKPRYDGRCRDADCHDDAPYVIRFRSPQKGAVSFDDRIRGEITIQNSELDDLILARTDGTPTYNFTVVVDDWEMRITHVIRGEDHINNTPRQIHLLRALGAEIPVYAHLPMIHGSDGKKLSKRHGAVSVLQYREAGYLPEALVNYLVRLGWAHGDQEIFSIDEMVQYFDLSHVSRSPAVFNFEKLDWLNQHYFKTTDPTLIAKPLSDQFQVLGVSDKNGPSLEAIVRMQAERCKTLKEMAERSRYFYESVETYDEKALKKHFKPEVLPGLRLVRAHLAELSHWDQEALHRVVVEVAESLELKLGKLAQPIRIAMTGNTVSPPIDLTLLYLGRERVLERLDHAIQFLEGD